VIIVDDVQITEVEAKNILNTYQKIDSWFGIKCCINIYRGCQHACVYCDTRSECYGIIDLNKITVKINAPELLKQSLKRKREKHTIGFGSMNDPYMPIEKKYGLTRQCLEVISTNKFPIHIITKSNLILRDIKLIKEISKIYSAVSFTITTADDELASIIEPHAPSPSQRFEAMSILSIAGIYTGVTLMPVLPFIEDTEENITSIIDKAKDAGASYIISSMGMTLRDKQREYYYNFLDQYDPDIKEKYVSKFTKYYHVSSPNYKNLKKVLANRCSYHGLPMKMKSYYQVCTEKQLELF
jgi:DNA repair photolyase